MRNIQLIITLFTLSHIGFGQSPEILARAAFVSAQEYYGNGDFKAAIDKLNQVKTLLNATNPKVDHLLTLSYAEMGEVANARASLKNYFDQASDTDPNYMQMLGMVDKLEKIEKEIAIQRVEDEYWANAQRLNTREAYNEYLKKYPLGKYVKLAWERAPNYRGKITKRSSDLRPELGPGEYSYIIGTPERLLTEGMIDITFERVARSRGGMAPVRVVINGEEKAEIRNGASATINVPAGKIEIYLLPHLNKYSKVLFYPQGRNEKFIIDINAMRPEEYAHVLQHEESYVPDKN